MRRFLRDIQRWIMTDTLHFCGTAAIVIAVIVGFTFCDVPRQNLTPRQKEKLEENLYLQGKYGH